MLLRSFADDPAAVRSGNPFAWFWPKRKTRLEEVLASALAGFGRLVAIGHPAERLPKLGAERFYFAEQDWQAFVQRAMAESRAVVMIVGLSQWVKWELGELTDRKLLEKLVLFLPPPSNATSQQRWKTVVSALKDSPWSAQTSNVDTDKLIAVILRKSGETILIYSRGYSFIDYDLGAKFAMMMLPL